MLTTLRQLWRDVESQNVLATVNDRDYKLVPGALSSRIVEIDIPTYLFGETSAAVTAAAATSTTYYVYQKVGEGCSSWDRDAFGVESREDLESLVSKMKSHVAALRLNLKALRHSRWGDTRFAIHRNECLLVCLNEDLRRYQKILKHC